MSESQRQAYERAADLEGVSVSALVTGAADEKAEELLRLHSSMTVPSDVFDRLLAALDEPATIAPALKRALRKPLFENR